MRNFFYDFRSRLFSRARFQECFRLNSIIMFYNRAEESKINVSRNRKSISVFCWKDIVRVDEHRGKERERERKFVMDIK